MCQGKRSFDKFAEPPLPFKWGDPFAHRNEELDNPVESSGNDGSEKEYSDGESCDSESSDSESSNGESLDTGTETESDLDPAGQDPKEPTIGDLIAAGSDTTQILANISSLTNEIHPMFSDENICACEYEDHTHCVAPYYAAHPEELAEDDKAPEIASPFAKDNILVRAILQLATKIMTHEETLPFWAGIVTCGLGPSGKTPFYVHPRKKLSPARKAETLQHLEDFADNVRFHFKAFNDHVAGYTDCLVPEEGEPDYDPSKDPWDSESWCKCPMNEYCQCRQGAVYAYKDGKAVVQDDILFQHIFLNVDYMKGFDQSSNEWRDLTISKAKKVVFQQATNICHELAHAFMAQHVQLEVPTNEEPIAEPGFCWENFVFGGTLDYSGDDHGGDNDAGYDHAGDDHAGNDHECEHDGVEVFLVPWPSLQLFEMYNCTGDPMPIRRFGKLDYGRPLPFDPSRWMRFLDQSFWDEEKPSKDFKKMWLRPYIEEPMHPEEYAHFNPEADSPPVEVMAKKRRLSDATMERERLFASKLRRAERMLARPGRESRYVEKLAERKEEFHELEKHNLNALWESFTEDFETGMFLKKQA